jgi:aspartyl protease family protein
MPPESASPDRDERPAAGIVMAAWLIVLGLLTWFFSGALEEQRNPNQQVSTLAQADANEVVLQRNRFGHYVATGSINGRRVELMLDTGASDVSVPAGLADALGLERGARAVYRTANGVITAYLTVLDRVELGGIVLENVRASINPAVPEDQVLLGMSFLKQVEFTQRGNTLTLRQPH